MDSSDTSKKDVNFTDSNAGKEITCSVYSSFEDLQGMQEEWDSFVETVSGDIFLTFDWCRIWWKYYGRNRELRIFVFRSNGDLVGIIPLFFETIWLGPVFVRAAKIVGSDCTLAQFSLPICKRYISETIRVFLEALSKYTWDIIQIGPIAGLYEHYDLLKRLFMEDEELSYRVHERDVGVQTYFKLEKDWDSHLSTLSKNGRRSVKRNYKALYQSLEKKESVIETRCADPDDFETIFAGFVDMHQSHWQNLRKAGHFVDWPKSYEYHKEVAENQMKHGRLRMMVSKCGGYPLGYEYGYRFGNRYYAFLNSRIDSSDMKKVSFGIPMFCEQAKMAIDEDVEYIDAMRGKYDYKMRLGGKLFPIRNIYLIASRLLTVIRVSTFWAMARLLNLLYYKIWFCRLAPKLPFKRRPLWKIWIRSRL